LNNYGTKYINSDWRILWEIYKRTNCYGKYSSVSEVVRTALRHFEEEENQKSLINELEIEKKPKN
jgi:Arc/MetJ-type ribon-helix-helix transcriptional regulator